MRLSERGDIKQRSKLDPDQAIAWLDQHWKGTHKCPICTNDNWTVSDDLVEVGLFKGGALVVGGALFPFMVVTCNTCGHTLLFNAIKAGLVQGQE